MESFPVYDPTVEVKVQPISLPTRPHSLKDLRIGLVENTKYNSYTLLLKIGAILQERFGARSYTIRSKKNASVSAHQELIDELIPECDIVISGIGD